MGIATSSGSLAAVEEEGLVHARGIPYATAERFEPPRPVRTPELQRDASRRGPACPQDPSRLETVTGPIVSELEQREECLGLSVTAPTGASGLPVMVWFHGGAYMSGGGESPKYDPDDLAREGVVVVNVTYRLGAFGYLTPEGADVDNLGLRDQIEALRWVAENIAAFGGTADQVTVFGQSAGGDSVIALLASEHTRGLIHRAIAQSAPLGIRGDRRAMTRAMRSAFTEHLPEAATTADVLAAGRKAIAAAGAFGAIGGFPYAPILGADPLPVDLGTALADVAPDVELFVGHTKHDASPFVALDPRAAKLAKLGVAGRAIRPGLVRAVTHRLFGIAHVVDIWRTASGKVATYRLDWAPAGNGLGACHCLELPMLFNGDWSDAPMLAGQPPPPELTQAIRRAWTTFARSGADALDSQQIRFR